MTDDCFDWEVSMDIYEIYTSTGESALIMGSSMNDAIDKFIAYWHNIGVSYDREELTAKQRSVLL